MYVQLIKDVALLVALTSLHSMLARLRRKGEIWPRLASGLLFGGVAVIGMALPFQYQPGIIYDGRSIILALAGLFGGAITTAVSIVAAGTYRALLGGVGVWAGLASIVVPALVGLVFRRACEGKPENLGILPLYGLGLAAHLLMLACQLLLPWPTGLAVIGRIWVPVMLIFPLATLLTGLLLQAEGRRAGAEAARWESEDRFKHVFESANVGKSITLPTGEINVNKAFCDLLGYTEEELRNRKWQELTPAEDVAGLQRLLDPLLRGEKESARFDKRYLHKNRDIIWCDVSVAMRRDAQGRPLHFITTVVDITASKRAEEESRSLAARNFALLGAIPDIVMEVDRDRKYRWANPAGLEFFGEQVIGREAADFFVGQQDTYSRVERLFGGDEQTIYLESWQRRRDGQKRLLAWWCRALRDSSGKVTGALSTARDITESRKAEEDLAVSEANLFSLIASTDDIVVSRDREGRVVAFNEAFASIVWSMFGAEARPGLQTTDFLSEPEKSRWDGLLAKVLSGEDHHEEFSWQVEGRTRHFELALTPIRAGGQIIGTAEYTRDITERRRTEEQLRQSQKMETVGRLAGGVAHDFNNMLQVISSYVELSLQKAEAGSTLEKYLREVRRAAQRSADLVGQLLAFARRQTVSPRVVDLNEVVSATRKMIQRLIGEDIDLAWVSGRELWKVKIDPTQVDQLLANLAVNARDAIGGVGRLTVETGNFISDQEYCAAHPGFAPGQYVRLAVSDDGRGMDKETMGHLFEPFFTTKGQGKGTGLGLATVYGIVKQNRGFIDVYSQPGQGSTFTVYLPRASEPEVVAEEEAETAALRGGTETVLVMEDEAEIRKLAGESLESLGYRVLTASSPQEAIRNVAEHDGPLHLVITDVVMPQMNGRQLFERLAPMRPGLRCLYISGYTADVIADRGVLKEGTRFLGKPFTLDALARKVREVLDQAQGDPPLNP